MSRIAYDPVKDRFAGIIHSSRILRGLFYRLLDLFFLRSWYVRDLLKSYATSMDNRGEWELLDAGSGFGQYDRFLLSQFSNINITSVDVKEDYLRDSRQYFRREIEAGRINFEKVDLLKFDAGKQYDFVICIDVLEHIEDDRCVIQNLVDSLREGGYFLMHSPSVYSEEDAGEDDTFVDEHARTGYSKKDIRDKIESAGLKPIDVAYTYGKKGHLAWELLIKYPMLWMTKAKLWALPLMAVYYVFTLPVGLVLMKLDMKDSNVKGTGIYALGKKTNAG